MNLRQLISAEISSILGGLWTGGSPKEEERNTFVVDPLSARDLLLEQYGVWYSGKDTELWNFYHRVMTFDAHWEPWLLAPLRKSFWATAVTEGEVKVTHSGQPQNLIDTTANLVGYPEVTAHANGQDLTAYANALASEFWDYCYPDMLKMTMVKGWGCLKLSYDKSVSDHPYCSFYKAEDVDFAYKGGKLMGIAFKDWYTDGDRRFLKLEIRALEPWKGKRRCRIVTKVYEQFPTSDGNAELSKAPFSLQKAETTTLLGAEDLFAYPTVFKSDPSDPSMYGSSFFENKIPLFDDLDQMLSVESQCVQLSVPEELFNTDFLEKDPQTGLPKSPKRYNRRYVMYHGGRSSDGAANSASPVQVAQPQINIQQYAQGEIEIMSHICSGWLSLATLGIQVATQATAQAQKEKEKVTKSTRDWIVRRCRSILTKLFSGWVRLDYAVQGKGDLTPEVSVEYPDFSATSFEDRLAACSEPLSNGCMSPEMFMRKVYMRELPGDAYAKELDYLKQMHQTPEEQMEAQAEAQGGQGMPMEGQ